MKYTVLLRKGNESGYVASVPAHPSIDTGTLDSILEGAGLSVDQFRALL